MYLLRIVWYRALSTH